MSCWFVVSTTRKERREHHNSDDRSGGTPVPPPPQQGSTPSPHSEMDTRKSGARGHRFARRVGEYVRRFLHLPRSGLAKMGANRRREMVVEKRTLEAEFIDQREEVVIIRDDSPPYLISRPIPDGRTLKKVVITTVSKDQGRSSYLEHYCTYRNSWTWFELSIGSPGSGEKWRGLVAKNLHAHNCFREHTIERADRVLYERARSGDVLTVWACAKFPGWENTVKKVTMRYVVE